MLNLNETRYLVPDDLREIYMSNGVLKKYPQGTKIVVQGDMFHNCCYIHNGFCAYLHLGYDGSLRAFNLISDGVSFGETPSMLEEPAVMNLVCLSDTEVYEIPFKKMLNNMTREQIISLMRYTVKQNMCTHLSLGMFFSLDATQRILLFFRIYADIHRTDDVWNTLKFRITHEVFADVIGTRRVTVTLVLNSLKHAGYIRYDGPHIQFHNDIISDDFILNGYHSIKQ